MSQDTSQEPSLSCQPFSLFLPGRFAGIGKTATLEALAQKCRLDLYDLNLSKIRDERQLQMLLTAIKNPALVVIDEIEKRVPADVLNDHPGSQRR